MTQIGILLICCKAYIGWIPSDMIGEQTIFLASLRSRFFHHIMPIEQGLLWFINILFMILSSVGCAYIAFRQRLRRKL